jgi:RNA polymerase sigma-70 factor, ECF subfamily
MTQPNPLEKELIDAACLGDDESFAALIYPYRKKISYLCYGILKDQELAEDTFQEACLHAYQHLKEFRKESSFYTWFYAIAKNLSLNALKKRKRQTSKEKSSEEPEKQKISKRFSRFQKKINIDETELLSKLQEALKSLKPAHRQVFEMFVLEDKHHREIATLLNIPEGTVRSRLYYARKNLRKILKT